MLISFRTMKLFRNTFNVFWMQRKGGIWSSARVCDIKRDTPGKKRNWETNSSITYPQRADPHFKKPAYTSYIWGEMVLRSETKASTLHSHTEYNLAYWQAWSYIFGLRLANWNQNTHTKKSSTTSRPNVSTAGIWGIRNSRHHLHSWMLPLLSQFLLSPLSKMYLCCLTATLSFCSLHDCTRDV